jgi:lysozyme
MGTVLKVVDVSRHNGEINFSKLVAAGVEGIAIRATIGDYYTDPRFYSNWFQAEEHYLYRTAYHVVKPSISPKLQMAHFFKVVGDRRPYFGKYGWVMDCELIDGKSKQTITDAIWYGVVEASRHSGKAAFIYTRMSYWNHVVNPSPNWKAWPLWVARYTAAPAPWFASEASYLRPRPDEWSDWMVWQYSADGNYQGQAHGAESPHIDLNRARAEIFEEVQPPPEPEPEPVLNEELIL